MHRKESNTDRSTAYAVREPYHAPITELWRIQSTLVQFARQLCWAGILMPLQLRKPTRYKTPYSKYLFISLWLTQGALPAMMQVQISGVPSLLSRQHRWHFQSQPHVDLSLKLPRPACLCSRFPHNPAIRRGQHHKKCTVNDNGNTIACYTDQLHMYKRKRIHVILNVPKSTMTTAQTH